MLSIADYARSVSVDPKIARHRMRTTMKPRPPEVVKYRYQDTMLVRRRLAQIVL